MLRSAGEVALKITYLFSTKFPSKIIYKKYLQKDV